MRKKWMLMLLCCLLLLSGCGEQIPEVSGSGEDAPYVDSNGANYPYDDLDEPQYYGYAIAPRQLEVGNAVYREIGETDLPLYRNLCADEYGKYFPMQALYDRYLDYTGNQGQQLSLYRKGDGTFLKGGQESLYEEFLAQFPELETLCEGLLTRQQNGGIQDVLKLHFIDGEAPVCCFTTSVDYHDIYLICAPEAAVLGEEAAAFADFMKGISKSEDASCLYEQNAAVAYYYHQIHKRGTVNDLQRFYYYAWMEKNGREYLLQVTSQMSLAQEKGETEPDGIGVFEDVLSLYGEIPEEGTAA